MKNTLRTQTKMVLTGTLMTAVMALAVATLTPTVQIIPSAYAATATGGSAITEGACSTGSFANNLLASLSTSCGPNSSGSAAGPVAICKGQGDSLSVAIDGTCSIGN